MIIGLSGNMQTGKSTIGKYLSQILSKNGENWEMHSFADKLKEGAAELIGVKKDLFEHQSFKMSKCPKFDCTNRQFLQNYGNGLRAYVDNDIWVKLLLCDYDKSKNWIITDVRFKNEYDSILKLGGKVYRICRNTGIIDNDISEHNLDSVEFDNVINNNGTLSDLYNECIKMAKDI